MSVTGPVKHCDVVGRQVGAFRKTSEARCVQQFQWNNKGELDRCVCKTVNPASSGGTGVPDDAW